MADESGNRNVDAEASFTYTQSHISGVENESSVISAEAEVDLSGSPILSWSHPNFTGKSISARGGHTSSLVGNLLITFGGHYFGDGAKFQYCKDVWAVDIDTMTWHSPRCAGRGPGARYGHCAVVVDYRVYIFGGKGPNGLLYNDCWCLDVENWSWSLMPSTTAPPIGRFNHAAVAVGSKMAIFGGWDGNTCYDDLWVYDIAARSWLKPKISGPKPAARHGHSMVMAPDGRLLVFGGWSMSSEGWPTYRNDLRQLDMREMAWTRARVSGTYPTPRYAHGSVLVGPYMLIFGGYSGNRIKASTHASRATQKAEESRYSSKRDIQKVPNTLHPDELPPPVGIAVATSGEEVPIGRHPDVWLLDTRLDVEGTDGNMVWSQPLIAGQPVGKRYGHSFTSVGTDLLAIAGWDGNKSLNDVVQLNVSALLEHAGLLGTDNDDTRDYAT